MTRHQEGLSVTAGVSDLFDPAQSPWDDLPRTRRLVADHRLFLFAVFSSSIFCIAGLAMLVPAAFVEDVLAGRPTDLLGDLIRHATSAPLAVAGGALLAFWFGSRGLYAFMGSAPGSTLIDLDRRGVRLRRLYVEHRWPWARVTGTRVHRSPYLLWYRMPQMHVVGLTPRRGLGGRIETAIFGGAGWVPIPPMAGLKAEDTVMVIDDWRRRAVLEPAAHDGDEDDPVDADADRAVDGT